MFVFPSLLSTFGIGAVSRAHSRELAARADDLIELIGLSAVRDQPAGMLSFGQQKLVQFASSLMTKPRLMLLDEPLAGINPVLIERIVSSIRQANRDLGITFVVIEHNIDVIMGLAERIIVLDQGTILDQGPPAAIVKSPKVVEAYLGG